MNKKLESKLNVFLANQMVNYVKLHNLHWYVKGISFFTLHAKLEEYYDSAAEVIDEVAERLLALKSKPVANLKEALELATIKELDNSPKSTDDVLNALVSDTKWWIKDVKEIIALAEEDNDVVTADIFTGYLANYEKLAWMFDAYTA